MIKTSLVILYMSQRKLTICKVSLLDADAAQSLAKKPSPLILNGKVSPVIQNYAEMNLGICTCFTVFQITKLFLDKLTSVLF